MKLFLSLAMLLFVVVPLRGNSQNTYKIKNYELFNVDASGNKYNLNKFEGSKFLDYITVRPKISIEIKFNSREGSYIKTWRNGDIVQSDEKMYSYELLNTYPSDNKNGIIIVLFFNTASDKLIRVFYMASVDNVKVGCYLYPDNQ